MSKTAFHNLLQGLDPRVTFFESSHVFKQIDLESNDQVKISAVEEILL